MASSHQKVFESNTFIIEATSPGHNEFKVLYVKMQNANLGPDSI